jgi:aspartokinase
MQILKEKDKLTQYDVDRAEKVLEVEKARIALEEARNNKTTMRLKRDASGNYSYQFTVDEEAIDQAQNNLDKAQNDLYNFDL